MVDWQFTVFCREVGFVEIYAFLVLNFFGQKCISAICITFCKGDPNDVLDGLKPNLSYLNPILT